MNKTITFIFIFLAGIFSVQSQEYADKKYYLVDSLMLEELSKNDSILLDSVLQLYHQTKSDTLKLTYINKITEECLNDKVWPKYNELLYYEAKLQLTSSNLSKKERLLIKKSLAAAINNKGYVEYNLGNIDKAIYYYKNSMSIYNEINDKDGLSICYNNIGSIYDDKGQTDAAIEYYLRSLSISKEMNKKEDIALCMNNLGYVYSDVGKIEEALSYYSNSVKLLEELGDKQVLATTLNNIGFIYKTQNDTEKASEYFFKCLKIYKEIDYKEGIAGVYNNIGMIYSKNNNTLDTALIYYKKSLMLQEELNHLKGIGETSNNIGIVYQKQGDYLLAESYFNRSLSIQEKIDDKTGVAHSFLSIGELNLLLNNNVKAKQYILKSFKISKELGFPELIRNTALALSEIYNKEKNYKKEIDMYRLYIMMRDSINNEDTKRLTIEHEIKYQYEKQALKDSLARVETQKIKDLQYKQDIKQQKTYTYVGLIGLMLTFLVMIVVFRGYQLKNKGNIILEEKNVLIEEKNREITESINYAKRIQKAILPSKEELFNLLKDCFVFYKPKDIVAGDFYWTQKVGDLILYATADCTGHGVPGAIVSVVCHNALNSAVKEYGLIEPAAILNKTRELVIDTFKRSDDKEYIKDGMDISLCAINFDTLELQFSGANNPLYIINSGKLSEVKGDKQPIGVHTKNISFSNHIIKLNKGDLIYTFSDGYVDQFGGPKGKKFMHKQFKELLLSIENKSMKDQQKIIKNTFHEWMGDSDQIDDVCVIGVKV